MFSVFTQHPRSVGESYLEHLAMAWGFGLAMLTGGLACLLHGFFPFLFERTGSNCVARLHATMSKRGAGAGPPGSTR